MSENKIDKIKQALYEPLPDEAIKPHPTKDYLNTINAIYVTDRLNDVFGLDGWTFKADIVEVREVGNKIMVVVKVLLICGDVRREQFGGNDNIDLGDAYKGAVTDALTKCASMIGVGVGVWKNEYKKGNKKSSYGGSQPVKAVSNEATDKQIAFIKKLCTEKEVDELDYVIEGMTKIEASEIIETLNGIKKINKSDETENLPF